MASALVPQTTWIRGGPPVDRDLATVALERPIDVDGLLPVEQVLWEQVSGYELVGLVDELRHQDIGHPDEERTTCRRMVGPEEVDLPSGLRVAAAETTATV